MGNDLYIRDKKTKEVLVNLGRAWHYRLLRMEKIPTTIQVQEEVDRVKEKVLAKCMGYIGLLARDLGTGSLDEKIREIIESIENDFEDIEDAAKLAERVRMLHRICEDSSLEVIDNNQMEGERNEMTKGIL